MCPGIGIGTVGMLLNRSASILPPTPLIEYVCVLVNDSPNIPNMDGLAAIETDEGKLLIEFGWSVPPSGDPPYSGFPLPGYTSKQQFISNDSDPLDFDQIEDADFPPSHRVPLLKGNDGTIYRIGGDSNSGYIIKNISKRDKTTGLWTTITDDPGLVYGDRYGFPAVIDSNDVITIIGGAGPLDIIQSTDYGLTWVQKSVLPDVFLEKGFSEGSAAIFNNHIYFGGGYIDQQKFAKVTMDGTTITMLPDIEGEMLLGVAWNGMTTWSNRLWWNQGTGTEGNKTGLFWMQQDGVWNKLSSFPIESTHAGTMPVFKNELYQISGLFGMTVSKVIKIPYTPLTTVAHWSLQKVNPNYTGYCIRVYKIGSGLIDIGFDVNGMVDVTALMLLAAGGDVYVETIYDQIGSNNWNGTDTSYIPIIIEAGVLVLADNSLPGVKFQNGDVTLTLPAPLNLSTTYCISNVMSFYSTLRVFIAGIDGNRYVFYNTTTQTIHNNAIGFSMVSQTLFEVGRTSLMEVYRNRMGAVFYENGVKKNTTPTTSFGGHPSYLDTDFHIYRMGGEYGFDQGYRGIFQETKIQVGVIESNSAISNQSEIRPRWNL